MFWGIFWTVNLLFVNLSHATPYQRTRAFDGFKKRASANTSSLTVDLGYGIYQGILNSTTGLNNWLGVRYAAPPTGQNRWQAPLAPNISGETFQAGVVPPRCPQAPDAGFFPPGYNFTGSEDCLFLSVYAPPNAMNLPVLVYIHGGGYGTGGGETNEDLGPIIVANNHSFIGVTIQYRLGAFGFLSSDEVYRNGVVNAGLLDQHFALQWVQSYIRLFGGDPTRVTLSGESAGGGAVLLQNVAYGGTQGDTLFDASIAASPFLSTQYGYADWQPSQSYYAFAAAVGCFSDKAYGNQTQTIFACLVSKDTATLQNASASISASGKHGTWAFNPVTDGVFIQELPSRQLLEKRVNGNRMLIGNNANEGPDFVSQDLSTEDDLLEWLPPLLYPASNISTSTLDFATSGYTGPTALNESQLGTGPQQRANNIFAESAFVCPSYWLADAYTDLGRTAYKYQYSVPPATHGSDVADYFGPKPSYVSPDFEKAFMQLWGNFVTKGTPALDGSINGTAAAVHWPEWSWNTGGLGGNSGAPGTTSGAGPMQLNLNVTGGTPIRAPAVAGAPNVTVFVGPGIMPAFSLVDAYSWEGGRGVRCEFWRSVAAIVPK